MIDHAFTAFMGTCLLMTGYFGASIHDNIKKSRKYDLISLINEQVDKRIEHKIKMHEARKHD